ncbi:hypothetical protein ACIQUS_24485 [Pseudomonas sp. NPDC090755]|uniref:hypothetical protein n=1 Tax=Pseudomonas sp. NPDC090755 TaxID=3364481 RepID=UPI00383AC160
MIDISTWPPSIVIAFGLAPFAIMLAGIAMGAYIACSRDFNSMLDALPNSLWLKQQIPFWGTTSLKARCYLVNTVCAAMLFPQLGIRRGLFNADEMRNFPTPLKRRMIASVWLTTIGFAWMFIDLGLFKLSRG